MYHLFVSGSDDTWDSDFATLTADRCLKNTEWTAPQLVEEYCQYSREQIALLIQLPAIFAYETGCKRDARLGRVRAIRKHGMNVRVDFQFLEAYPPITNDLLKEIQWDLGIHDAELYRTHWALKDEDLSAALQQAGFPAIPFVDQPLVNIHEHEFQVALSFPGELRGYVESVARQLVRAVGHNSVFYDNFYKSQLAIPNLDTALQAIYRHRSRLIVAFLSQDYASKKWCGIEFRAIREIINEKNNHTVMFVRHDNAAIDGVFSNDGYIDANSHTEAQVAAMIHERVILQRNSANQNH